MFVKTSQEDLGAIFPLITDGEISYQPPKIKKERKKKIGFATEIILERLEGYRIMVFDKGSLK